MSVPDSNTFGLDAVRSELGLSYPSSLSACFAAAVDAYFDPAYKGNKDRLSNFRNYNHTTIEVFPVYTSATDTIECVSSISWKDCRESSYGTVVGVDPYSIEIYRPDQYSWIIRRTFLAFDLSSLSGKKIVSASLKMGQRVRNGAYPIQVFTGTQSNNISGTDYDNYTTTYILSGTQSEISQSACSPISNYINIVATSSNLITIQGYFGSIIKMALLHAYDYSNMEPSIGTDYYYRLFRAGEIGTNCYGRPLFVIEYR